MCYLVRYVPPKYNHEYDNMYFKLFIPLNKIKIMVLEGLPTPNHNEMHKLYHVSYSTPRSLHSRNPLDLTGRLLT